MRRVEGVVEPLADVLDTLEQRGEDLEFRGPSGPRQSFDTPQRVGGLRPVPRNDRADLVGPEAAALEDIHFAFGEELAQGLTPRVVDLLQSAGQIPERLIDHLRKSGWHLRGRRGP